MNDSNAQIYLTSRMDQLRAAVADGDGREAERIVDQVDADGFQAAAAVLGEGLARTSVGDQVADETPF